MQSVAVEPRFPHVEYAKESAVPRQSQAARSRGGEDESDASSPVRRPRGDEPRGDPRADAGDHVAYAGVSGSYAEFAVVPSWRLVKVPKGIDPETAAAAMLQGMTAHYLSHDTYPLKPRDACLVHAAAGGGGPW